VVLRVQRCTRRIYAVSDMVKTSCRHSYSTLTALQMHWGASCFRGRVGQRLRAMRTLSHLSTTSGEALGQVVSLLQHTGWPEHDAWFGCGSQVRKPTWSMHVVVELHVGHHRGDTAWLRVFPLLQNSCDRVHEGLLSLRVQP
jgi:hypothetical protein